MTEWHGLLATQPALFLLLLLPLLLLPLGAPAARGVSEAPPAESTPINSTRKKAYHNDCVSFLAKLRNGCHAVSAMALPGCSGDAGATATAALMVSGRAAGPGERCAKW